ncbi:hypothetical protein RvY_18403 [Ramazzottius varieornatus]|uniref:F-box domain-containing protein n=1 Tax=Ramazzottius varieornatus TaxID=947166 RepID=A0A1D1W5L7_RAMVA|nr:hypothetical protein RvY_18403 [Ramazzottius varieornatus]
MADSSEPFDLNICSLHLTIDDLPDEILVEIFGELEALQQRLLQRTCARWKRILLSRRLQLVVRMDVKIELKGKDPRFKFSTFPALVKRATCLCRSPHIGRCSDDLLPVFRKILHNRTTVIQLNWIENSESYSLIEALTAWVAVFALVSQVKTPAKDGTLAEGANLTHVMLDNAVAIDGLHNLIVLAQTRTGRGSDLWRNHDPVPFKTIAYRRCRFELFGYYTSLFNNPSQYRDSLMNPFPSSHCSWVRPPMRVLDLTETKEALEQAVANSIIQSLPPLPSSIWDTLRDKVRELSTVSQMRWKAELIRKEKRFSTAQADDISLEDVEWSQLGCLTLLFFLCFDDVRIVAN